MRLISLGPMKVLHCQDGSWSAESDVVVIRRIWSPVTGAAMMRREVA